MRAKPRVRRTGPHVRLYCLILCKMLLSASSANFSIMSPFVHSSWRMSVGRLGDPWLARCVGRFVHRSTHPCSPHPHPSRGCCAMHRPNTASGAFLTLWYVHMPAKGGRGELIGLVVGPLSCTSPHPPPARCSLRVSVAIMVKC